MGKNCIRYFYGYCWQFLMDNLVFHKVGGLRCRLRANRSRVRAIRQEDDNVGARKGDGWKASCNAFRRRDGASTVLDASKRGVTK